MIRIGVIAAMNEEMIEIKKNNDKYKTDKCI